MEDYYNTIEKVEENNYKKSAEILKKLLYAHGNATAILNKIITSQLKKPGKTNEKIEMRLLQIAVFYQGIATCEKTIRNAQYNISAAIVRQEYEIICNLHEIENNLRKPGKTPNAKNGIKNFGKQYGVFSKLTHVTDEPSWMHFYRDEEGRYGHNINPIRLFPVVDDNACVELYGDHIYFIIIIIEELSKLFEEMYGKNPLTQDMEDIMMGILSILVEYGVLILIKE